MIFQQEVGPHHMASRKSVNTRAIPMNAGKRQTYVTVWPSYTHHTWHPGLVVQDSGYKVVMTTYGAHKASQATVAEYGPTDANECVFILTHA